MAIRSNTLLVCTFILLPGLFSSITCAQEPAQVQYMSNIKLINVRFDTLRKFSSDSLRLDYNQKIIGEFKKILQPAQNFRFSPDSLKFAGQLLSPDKKFRILTWNVPLTDGTYRYFGFIQMAPQKDSTCVLHSLNDISYTFTSHPLNATFSASQWFGALYYQMVMVKANNKQVYTLLATRFNNLFTSQKLIESLYFDENNSPVFGMPIFETAKKIEKRIIFEYSINAVMSLKYFDETKMIVFDHLAPPSNLYDGNYRFYGPDFSFDAYKFERVVWRLHLNIDFKKAK